MEKEIISVLKYFSFFAYQPTLEEIHTFLPAKISKNELKMELDRLKYTPPQYSIERKISKRKLKNWRFKVYVKLLSFFPQIKLVGLSGSIAMMNARTDDDIDLFIITAKNRLFTGRFIALILAQILGLRRKRDYTTLMRPHSSCIYKNKVCLNLFFDESNLKVPKFKQTEFVGHEVLQMKPIINKNYTYEKFLEANKWVFELFPNAKSQINYKYYSGVIPVKTGIQTKITLFGISDRIEQILKNFQLLLINKHKTTEIITNSQLWFHPDDFGKKIFTDY